MPKEQTRRRFLLTLFLWIAAILGTRPFVRQLIRANEQRRHDLLVEQLENFYVHKESAAIIGKEYLRNKPDEADPNRLVSLICSRFSGQPEVLRQANPEKLRTLLLCQQREDFQNHRIAKLHGWILSETECRLCALAALELAL